RWIRPRCKILDSGCISFEHCIRTGNALGIKFNVIAQILLHSLRRDTQPLEAHWEKLTVLGQLNRQIVSGRVADKPELIGHIGEQLRRLQLGSRLLDERSSDTLSDFETRIID